MAFRFIALMFFTSSAFSFSPNCDLIGSNLKSQKGTTQQSCWGACESEEKCRGVVFVSGWKRCFLKSSVKRKASLKFFSEIRSGESGYNLDFTGKDLVRHVTSTKEECRDKCLNEKKCTGFTYLEGYRDCWIKHTKGRLFEKIFYCKEKKEKG